MQKKKNIWIYFIKMLLLFVILDFIQILGIGILSNSFKYLKYGPEIIGEAIWAVLVIIILLLFKNSYIFKENREKILKSLKFGWPLILISVIFLILNVISVGPKLSIPVVLNLAVYCLLIGIVEEFLCRGWLLNEFLERFSDSKIKIIYSIVLSSLVFGLFHITNILAGQSILETSLQIINATLIGIAFSLIYYKTKNIWSVVLIHGFWDFCVFIKESIYLGDCIQGTADKNLVLYMIMTAIIVVITLSVICYSLFKKTDLSNNNNNKLYNILIVISVIMYVCAAYIEPKSYSEYHICPTEEYKNIGENYETQYYHHNKYLLKYNDKLNSTDTNLENNSFNFELSLNNDNKELEFKNIKTGKKVVLTEEMVNNYLLVENEDSYFILIQKDINKILYAKYSKKDINDADNYLESVKNNLKEYNVPQIDKIGTITIGESNYKFPLILTSIYNKLYFDENDNLYIVSND